MARKSMIWLLLLAPALQGAMADVLQLGGSDRRLFDEIVGELTETGYRRGLQWYDERLAERPFDVVAAVERCAFIKRFVGWEDENTGYYLYFDGADQDYERCHADLRTQFPDHPELLLHELQQLYGDERSERGRQLFDEGVVGSWTALQQARLHTLLAQNYDLNKQADQAKWHALRAIELDLAADTRLIAAQVLIDEDDKELARQILTSPFDIRDPGEPWYMQRKLVLLSKVGRADEVSAMYARLKSAEQWWPNLDVARALAASGTADIARAEYEGAAEYHWDRAEVSRERFLFELDHGDAEQALEAYRAWRDHGYDRDPLLSYRLALASQHPALPWQARDIAGILTVSFALAVLALVPLVPLGLVHYRGLVRRSNGLAGGWETPGWGMAHAWYALFIILLVDFVGLYLLGPFDIWQANRVAFDPDAEQLARATTYGMMLGSLLAVPLLAAGWRTRLLWTQHWSPAKAASIGVAIALALRGPLLLALVVFGAIAPERLSAMRNLIAELQPMLPAVLEAYGAVTLLLVAVVAAPITEELIFRGALLRGLAGYISFGWANVLQAALFAALHGEPRFAPFLLALGLLAGWTARRSGGLLAPILMHATFNLVVVCVLIFVV